MYLKAEKLVQITTPLDTETSYQWESGYKYVDILCVGAGGGTGNSWSSPTYGGGSGSISYGSDIDITQIESALFTIHTPQTSTSQSVNYTDFLGGNDRKIYGRARSAINININTRGEGANSYSQTLSTIDIQRGGNGGGQGQSGSTSHTNPIYNYQGGGMIGNGDSFSTNYDNGCSESNPNTSKSGTYGGGATPGNPGTSAAPGAIPLFALGGTGKGNVQSTNTTNAGQKYMFVGGGGAGGYGNGGCGALVVTGASSYTFSATDGGYGAGAGGGANSKNPMGQGGQGIIVLRYH